MRIENGILQTMDGITYERGFVDCEGGVITAVGDMRDAPDYAGERFDARGGFILPGLIDAHTHIGISEEGLRWEGEDCNEVVNPVSPHLRAVDGFNPLDRAIPKAVAAGVTTVLVAPGSANVIGGQIAAIKLDGVNVSDMILKAPCAIKFALGENPKRTYGENKSKSPMTRMAIAALMRAALTKARRYKAKEEKGEDVWDEEDDALLPLLRGEIPAHFHAHRADDMLTAMRIANEFQLKYTIIHATQSLEIAPVIQASGIVPIVGPSLGPASKPETVGGSFETTGALYRQGIEVAVTTDHDVTPLWMLPVFAAMCVREGLPEDAALRAITINGAKAAGIDVRVGSLTVGKDADIVVFNGHPFELRTKAARVWIGGKQVK
ncbi:amidohydrolase [Clostridia bacterium]|nr:amidohydrolase [Clostridia bacterium]